MEWVRNHIILQNKNSEYSLRGNEKSVRLAGVEITLQVKATRKKRRTVQAGFLREALYETFRDFKWHYICLKQPETE